MITLTAKKLFISLKKVNKLLPILTFTLFAGVSVSHAAIIKDQQILSMFGNLQSVTGLKGTVSEEEFVSRSVSFDGFDSILGTLTGVSLNINGGRFEQIISYGVYDKNSEDEMISVAKGHFNTDIDVMSDGIFEYDINDSEKKSFNRAEKDPNNPWYNNYDLYTEGGLVRANIEYFDIDLNFDLSNYIVNGELGSQIIIDLNVSNWAQIWDVVSPSASVLTYATSGFQELVFDLEYEYTPERNVPSVVSEPSILGLMCIGILGLGACSRKIQSLVQGES